MARVAIMVFVGKAVRVHLSVTDSHGRLVTYISMSNSSHTKHGKSVSTTTSATRD